MHQSLFPPIQSLSQLNPQELINKKKPTSSETTSQSGTTDWINDIKQGQLVKNSTKQTANLVRQVLTSHCRASVVVWIPTKWVFASAAKSSITRLEKLGQLSQGWGVGARVSLTNHALPAPVTASPDCTASQSCAALRISGRLLL